MKTKTIIIPEVNGKFILEVENPENNLIKMVTFFNEKALKEFLKSHHFKNYGVKYPIFCKKKVLPAEAILEEWAKEE